ncbi:hypothetical protein GCM10007967_17270 [Xylanimonas ulmi]|uniref:CopC domain-containing protein n=1 Tax=Xylanimonas ulmi TaxID=228973 RepID=A0A4Q7M3K5_9MICO|nr:hypothetical protein EV386_2851 [Xylanibacterium ulmi]
MPARALSALLVALLAVGAALVGLAAPASAHDRLVSSDPADGTTLDAVPAAVTLTFSEQVLETGTQVVVTADGVDVGAQPAQVDGVTVTAPLPPDAPHGAYQVAWRIVSADGHPVEGSLTFTVAAPAPSPVAEPTQAAADSPADSATDSPADAATDSPADATADRATDTPTDATADSPADTASPTPAPIAASPSGGAVVGWIAAGVAVLAVALAGLAWGRRRGARVFGPPGQD